MTAKQNYSRFSLDALYYLPDTVGCNVVDVVGLFDAGDDVEVWPPLLHTTLASQSQTFNCWLKSVPEGQVYSYAVP